MSYIPYYYGSFWNTGQISVSANTPTPLTYNSQGTCVGVSVVSNSRITVAYKGLYNIAFSAQLDNTSGGPQTVGFWVSKGGNEIADTGGLFTLNNNEKKVAAWNYFVDANVNDYFELMFASPSANVILFDRAAQVSPPEPWTMPAMPSIIVTINKVN